MVHSKLHETLKSLNGLHNNPHKRTEICKCVEDTGSIAVFGYGSLLWNPVKPVDETIFGCTLHGYAKGFICKDFLYRGTMDFPGLTMGLKQHSSGTVNGALLIAKDDQIIPFIEAFVKRETPVSVNGTTMDIYTFEFLEIIMPDGVTTQYALACVMNTQSSFYLSEQPTLKQQAQIIARAYGSYGTNFQYLQDLKATYVEHNISDSFTSEFEDLYNEIKLCRQICQ